MSYYDTQRGTSRPDPTPAAAASSGGGGGRASEDQTNYASLAYQSNYRADPAFNEGGGGMEGGVSGMGGGGGGMGGPGAGGNEYGFSGGGLGGDETAFGASQRPSRTGGNEQWKTMIASVKGDTYKVAVVKASTSDHVAPKGKHVRTIVTALQMGGMVQDRNTPVGSVFYHMRKRLNEPDWMVICKCLTVFHHIFREGNERFVTYFVSQARQAIDVRASRNAAQAQFAPFVKSYSQYLLQWCAMKHAIKFPPGKVVGNDNGFVMSRYADFSPKKIFREMPILFDTMEVLMKINLSGAIKFTSAGFPAFMMIIKDASYVWLGLSRCMLSLIEVFFESELSTAKIALEFYQRFLGTVPNVKEFFEVLGGLGTNLQLPAFNVVTADLGQSMQEYINNANKKDEEDVEYSSDEWKPAQHYEPPEDYFSESDPEPEYYAPPPPPRRPKTPSSSSSSSESSESEPEPEPEPVQMPEAAPPPRPFDPLTDILGMQHMTIVQGGQITPYQQPVYHQPGFQNSTDARVQSIKSVMNGVQQQQMMQGGNPQNGQMLLTLPGRPGMQQQQPQPQPQMMGAGGGGGGLAGVYAQMQAVQMQRSQNIQQQQQRLQPQPQPMMSQAPAAFVSHYPQNMYQTSTGQFFQTNTGGMQMMATPMGQQVPAMQAAQLQQPQGAYRVQTGQQQQFVNASDLAFRGLENGMKRN